MPDDVSQIKPLPSSAGRSETLATPGAANIQDQLLSNSNSPMNTVNEEECSVNETVLTNKGGY